MTQDVLVDPAQLSFDQASRDPLEILTEGEQTQAERLIEEGHYARTTAEAAVVIGGAFLLYRSFVARRMARAINPNLTRTMLQLSADYYWRQFFPAWILVTSGALSGAGEASIDVRTGDVPEQVLTALGEDYAERLGSYLHESSKEALLEGFSANVNKRLPRQLAAKKAIEAFGLSQRQMRALQATKAPAPVNSVQDLNADIRTQAYIDQALANRAKTIGENEAFSISQEGKQLAWMWQLSKGVLPEDTQRMWVTARDERVCKTCGPMHRTVVPLTKPFDTPLGKMWSPSMHPSCRCEIVLKIPVTRDAFIRKDLFGGALADFNDEHPRGDAGRFTTKVKEAVAPVTTPQVAQVSVAQVAQVPQLTQIAQVAPVLPQVQAEVKQAQQAQAQVALPQAEAQQLVAVLAEMKAAPVAAPAVPKPQTKAVPKTKTRFSNIHTLEEDHYLVAEDMHAYGDGTKFHFSGEEFSNFENMKWELRTVYEGRLSYEAQRIISTGMNVIAVPSSEGADYIELDEEDVTNILRLAMVNDPNSPATHMADQMGFDRSEHAVDVFVVRQINADESTGDVLAYDSDYGVEVGGTYLLEDYGRIEGASDEDGYNVPVRYIWIDPVATSEDEELD